jgi:transcriptional regulator GlxA family with amidase domain
MSSQREIGMLLFPRLTQLDLTGPYEVLARLPNTTVHLVAQGLDPVKTDRGLMIVPTVTYAGCPQLDVVVVPGGPGQQELMEDEVVLGFLRSQAAHAKYVTSVAPDRWCSGRRVCSRANVPPATGPPSSISRCWARFRCTNASWWTATS